MTTLLTHRHSFTVNSTVICLCFNQCRSGLKGVRVISPTVFRSYSGRNDAVTLYIDENGRKHETN